MITLHLPKQGESITFFSEPDSSAPRVENEVRLAAGASGPPPHRHTKQSETFHVVSGTLILTVDGHEHTRHAGESFVVQPGQVHTFRNGSATEPLVVRGAVEPALHFQWFLTEMSTAAIRAGGSWKELPVLEAAYILHQVRDEYRIAYIPETVQTIFFGLLARIAVAFGRTAEITPKYEQIPTVTVPRPSVILED